LDKKDAAKIVAGVVGLTYVGASIKDTENIKEIDYEGFIENASEVIGNIPLVEHFNLLTESGETITTESGNPIVVREPVSYEIEFPSHSQAAIISDINER
jgi:hypothetical protein